MAKEDLGLCPIFHKIDQSIEAHVLIRFMAYCLHVTQEQYNKRAAVGLSSRSVLERMNEILMLGVLIPATDGRELRMKRCTKLEKVHQLLLERTGFKLADQLPLEIRVLWCRPFEKITAISGGK